MVFPNTVCFRLLPPQPDVATISLVLPEPQTPVHHYITCILPTPQTPVHAYITCVSQLSPSHSGSFCPFLVLSKAYRL